MFDRIANELNTFLVEWENKLIHLSEEQISVPRNGQHRNIRQIVGHMVDSASNNTHRIIHLQYNKTPLNFPNYATYGNNDRWISIQNYEKENWEDLVNLWKYLHLHIIHVIQQINPEKLHNEWMADKDQKVSLRDMVDDFPRHFRLHLLEIDELLKPNIV